MDYYFSFNYHRYCPKQAASLLAVKKSKGQNAGVVLMSSYSPNVYDGAIAEFRDICNYWQVENMGYVSAKIDEQKTDATLSKIQALVEKL